MLGIEVWAHWYESGHIKRPTVVMAVGIFAVGLLHGKIARAADVAGAQNRRRRVAVGGPPFQNFTATWDELAAVEIEPSEARLVRKDGKARTFNFRTCATPPTCARRLRA